MSVVKYVIVIVYGDFLKEARGLFCGFENMVRVDFANDFQNLVMLIKEKIPDLIIFYLSKDNKNYTSDLRSLRMSVYADKIPVYVCWTQPTRQELMKLLD